MSVDTHAEPCSCLGLLVRLQPSPYATWCVHAGTCARVRVRVWPVVRRDGGLSALRIHGKRLIHPTYRRLRPLYDHVSASYQQIVEAEVGAMLACPSMWAHIVQHVDRSDIVVDVSLCRHRSDPGLLTGGAHCMCETPQKCTIEFALPSCTESDEVDRMLLHTVILGKGLVTVQATASSRGLWGVLSIYVAILQRRLSLLPVRSP